METYRELMRRAGELLEEFPDDTFAAEVLIDAAMDIVRGITARGTITVEKWMDPVEGNDG